MHSHFLANLPHNSAQLTTLLIQTLKEQDWHIFWLYNNGKPVIGFLPKVVWVLDNNNHQLTTSCHQYYQDTYTNTNQITTFKDYQSLILSYHQKQKPHCHFDNPNNNSYVNGLLGYVSYDMSANQLNPNIAMQNGVLAFFGHYDYYLTFDNDKNGWQLCFEHYDKRFDMIIGLLDKLEQKLSFPTAIELKPFISKNAYQTAFDKTQSYLKAGDAYQVNLTQAFVGQSDKPLPLIEHLPNLFTTNAPFCAYLNIKNQEILSVSPELFFTFQKNSHQQIELITKPIKGTRPRHFDKTIDEQLKNELKNSQKDLAENVMIVDLLRNDLGKYAQYGKVSVPIKFAIESFSNVHHMVSTIQALLNNTPALTVLFDSLPAGSITGSPKKRACELIDELEIGNRGAYCGTMGYLNFDDTGQFNVLIRTLQSNFDGTISHINAWAGGGITVLSNCDEEYQECFDKIGQIKEILGNLI